MALIFGFQIEHIFPEKALFDNNQTLLNKIGFDLNMRGNRIALWSNPDTVDKIQNSVAGVKNLLLGAGWGLVRHDGKAAGGNQSGKNEFLNDQLTRIVDSPFTDDAKKYAVLELFSWT